MVGVSGQRGYFYLVDDGIVGDGYGFLLTWCVGAMLEVLVQHALYWYIVEVGGIMGVR